MGLTRTRPLVALLLLLLVASSAAAEYCKTQGSPAVPKAQTPAFDEKAFLSQAEIIASETKHLPWGRPECPVILFQNEYVLCYDLPRKVSGWASYRLEAADVVEATRFNAFRSDPRLPIDQNPSCDAYSGSGFDRGHLVPRSDMNRTKTALVNTFFLTNMSPQLPNVNQGTWARLEDLGREWAKAFNGVHIVSGTIFDDDDDHQPDDPSDGFVTKDGSDVSVPSHYFKIFLRMEAGELVSIAFIIPNTTRVPGRNAQDTTKDRFLKRSLRTVGDILERKGVDLFPDMSPELKAQLKAFRATELWSSN